MTVRSFEGPNGQVWARRWMAVIALVGGTVAGGLTTASDSQRAGAALSLAGAPCGFHLGAPFVTHATSSAGFEFPIYPADPHQMCQLAATAQASLVPATGGSYVNVSGSSTTTTLNLRFTGGPLPLGVTWTWRPACADPSAPAVFTLTMGSQSSSIAMQPPTSCYPDLGGSSTISYDDAVGIGPDPYVAVGMASTPDGLGYWTVLADGPTATARGDAAAQTPFESPTNAPVVGMASDPTGQGYWVLAADGGVFSFGGAGFFGSMGGKALNAPIVGMVATPDGSGYWLVAADGGVFSFGGAGFFGSMGGAHLNAPVVGMAATADGGGYWLAAYDGGVFALGDATFYGSAGDLPLAAPVVAMATTPAREGYWLLGADGGIFTYGDAGFYGSTPVGATG